jgi:hypothetical protein
MKIVCVVVGTALALALGVLPTGPVDAQEEAAAAAPEACDVLIVWNAGSPDAPPVPVPDAGPVDGYTQATPAAGNIRQTAEALGKELEAAGLNVVVVAAEKCLDPRQITQARALVLGAPDYYGLPPWQMVRFFDETLYRLYAARVRLEDHVVTAFATTDRCLGVIQGVLRSTRGKAVEGAVITPRRTTAEDREAAVKELAARITEAL